MDVLIFIAILSASFGALVGWFSKGKLLTAVASCVLVGFTSLVAVLLIMGEPLELFSLSPKFLVVEAIWFGGYYLTSGLHSGFRGSDFGICSQTENF